MASNGRLRAEKRSHAATTTSQVPSISSHHDNGAKKQARLSRAHQTANTRTALTDISNKRTTHDTTTTTNSATHKAANNTTKQTQTTAANITKPITRTQSRPTNDKENNNSHAVPATTTQPPSQLARPLRRSSRSAASRSTSVSTSSSSALQQSYSRGDSTISDSELNDESYVNDSYAGESDDSVVYDQQERLDDSQDEQESPRRDVAAQSTSALPTADSALDLASPSSSLPFPNHLPRSRYLTKHSNGTSSSLTTAKPSSSSTDYTSRTHEPAKPTLTEQSAALSRWQSSSQFKPDYSTSIFTHLLATERTTLPSPTYMDEVQGDLSFPMRAILLDWLVEVGEEYHLQPQTLWLCVAYVDRFLSVQPVDRSRLQLVGVVCMLIAAKYWEIYPPTIDDFVYISDHTYDRQQMLSMERSVLQALHFQLTVPTGWEFGRRLHSLCRMSDVEGQLMEYVMEAFMQEKEMLDWTPSIIAVSAAYLALSTAGRTTPIVALLCDVSGYEYRHIKECVRAMWTMHVRLCADRDGVIAAGTQGLKAVKDKYSTSKWNEVSKIRARVHIAEIK